MKILVTGATGFLGSRLVEALVAEQHQIVILKRSFSDLRRLDALLPQVAAYDLDCCELADPFLHHGPIDAIIHTATCYGRGGETVGEILEANTAFPLRLLERAVSDNVATFINMDTALGSFLNPYALSKKQFTQWGRLLSAQGRVKFVNMVLEHFYGPGDDRTKFTTHVIRSCLENVPELKLTKGEQKRDFVYIDDVVAACLLIVHKCVGCAPGFQEYGVGSGQAVFVREFVEKVHHLTRSTTNLDFGALSYRENEVMESQADIERLRALGWSIKVGLDEGIRRTVEYESERG